MTFTSEKPTVSALYLVDRAKQGKYYRYYNAESDTWGMCGVDMQEALDRKDKDTGIGFFPWVGPLTGPNFNRQLVVNVPVEEVKAKGKPVKPAKPVAPIKPVKPVKTKKSATNPGYVNGTVYFREDRQKWVAIWNGKQEAARPTKEGALAFLKKKYDFEGTVLE
jgi:hypothetical protein